MGTRDQVENRRVPPPALPIQTNRGDLQGVPRIRLDRYLGLVPESLGSLMKGLQERPEAEEHLPVEGVHRRQAAGALGHEMQRGRVGKLDAPGLGVV